MRTEIKTRVVLHAGVLMLAAGTLAGLANREVLMAHEVLKSPVPVATPDFLPERYRGLIPTPTPTPTPELPFKPLLRLSASAGETTPAGQLTEGDLLKMLEQLHSKREFIVADSLKALEEATPDVRCTINHEAGGGRKEYGYEPYDPYILDGPDIKGAFNYGIGQLAIKGKLREFLKHFKNPFNPYEVVQYMNWAFANEQIYHWGPVVLGLC